MTALNGKAVVITGSGRGIGAAAAILAAELGARVVVNDLDAGAVDETVEVIRAAGGDAVGHPADITDWSAAAGLIDACVDAFGRIDGLVNNAGLFRLARLEEQTEAEARAMIEVNVMGTLACAVHAMRHMVAQGGGSIVNVTSGAHLGIPAMGVYGATKGAVASFTYAWAAEGSEAGVRVNALSPLAASRMSDERIRYFGKQFEMAEPPASVNAPVIAYLLSDLSQGVTGQVIRLEGRHLALMAHPGVALPQLEGDWTVSALAEAFDRELKHRQFPNGIAALDVRVAGGGSAIWAAEDGAED